ncbi:MAG: hypothetical protein PWQ60_2617 [Thermoanaerobacteraceae bacterium]|jgi:predicted nucleic acid-binding protein|nr:hypothetical protein [Thermoanaerobacteraceae bacterium]
MRVFIDTTVILSAVIFLGSTVWNVIEIIFKKGTLVLCTYSISEIKTVIKRKFPQNITALEHFLKNAPFELIYTLYGTMPIHPFSHMRCQHK